MPVRPALMVLLSLCCSLTAWAQQLTDEQYNNLIDRGVDPREVEELINGINASKPNKGFDSIVKTTGENIGSKYGESQPDTVSLPGQLTNIVTAEGRKVIAILTGIGSQAVSDLANTGVAQEVKGFVAGLVHLGNTGVSLGAGGAVALIGGGAFVGVFGSSVVVVAGATIVGGYVGALATQLSKQGLDQIYNQLISPHVNGGIDQVTAILNGLIEAKNDAVNAAQNLLTDMLPGKYKLPTIDSKGNPLGIYGEQKGQTQGVVDMSDKGKLVEGPDVAKAPEKEKLSPIEAVIKDVAVKNIEEGLKRYPPQARSMPGWKEATQKLKDLAVKKAPDMARELGQRVAAGDQSAIDYLNACKSYVSGGSQQAWLQAKKRYEGGTSKSKPK